MSPFDKQVEDGLQDGELNIAIRVSYRGKRVTAVQRLQPDIFEGKPRSFAEVIASMTTAAVLGALGTTPGLEPVGQFTSTDKGGRVQPRLLEEKLTKKRKGIKNGTGCR